MTKPIRYRKDHEAQRRRVVVYRGFEGFNVAVTDSCSGCFEGGEYGGNAHNFPFDEKARCHVGFGCDECGYTGKRRHVHWIPFDRAAYRIFDDARWLRRERLLRFWQRDRAA